MPRQSFFDFFGGGKIFEAFAFWGVAAAAEVEAVAPVLPALVASPVAESVTSGTEAGTKGGVADPSGAEVGTKGGVVDGFGAGTSGTEAGTKVGAGAGKDTTWLTIVFTAADAASSSSSSSDSIFGGTSCATQHGGSTELRLAKNWAPEEWVKIS